MAKLIFSTWLWGDQYGGDYVERLASGLRRHHAGEYRFVLFTDKLRPEIRAARPDAPQMQVVIRDPELLKVKGCFARLRMFDPEYQAKAEINEGDRLVCLDLDMVITGQLDPLFNRPEPFMILQGANAANPCPFNGSVMMLRAGAHPEVWTDFSLEAAQKIPFYEFPDDQGWIHHKLPDAAGWKVGSPSGIYGFQKPGWPAGENLPKDARIVSFFGKRDPSQFTRLNWVRENWAA